jgi:hypothetical protein
MGDKAEPLAYATPAALLSVLPKEQKRVFVLAVTGGGAGIAYLQLALDRPPSGCERPSPDTVPVGAFSLRDLHTV